MTDFSDALRAVRAGQRARRAIWAETPVLDGWLERADLRADWSPHAGPSLVVRYPDGTWHLFAGSNWDLLADDWEILPGGAP